MADYVSGDPELLEAFAPEAAVTASRWRAEAGDYEQALAAFRSQPSDLAAPELADVGEQLADLAGQLEQLGEELAVFADALRQADAAAMQHGGVVTVVGGPARDLIDEVQRRLGSDERADRVLLGPWGAVLARSHAGVGLGRNLARTGAHAARLVESQARIARLRGDLLAAPARLGFESSRGWLHRVAQHRGLARSELTRALADRASAAADLWRNSPVTDAPRRLANSRLAQWAGKGARVLGWAGVAASGADAIQGLGEDDAERAATSGAATVGGAMMLTPVPGARVVGGVVLAGALLYDNREWLGDRAGEVVDGARWASDKLAEGGPALLDATADTANDAAEAAGDLAGEAAETASDIAGDAAGAAADLWNGATSLLERRTTHDPRNLHRTDLHRAPRHPPGLLGHCPNRGRLRAFHVRGSVRERQV